MDERHLAGEQLAGGAELVVAQAGALDVRLRDAGGQRLRGQDVVDLLDAALGAPVVGPAVETRSGLTV